ncbi:glycine reductase [Peptostreptococcus russellii]|uniref:Glycine reductase n=1 Tax=Peptostreptococcus russellii TaxID=215200 RepID=A0A2P7Q030_9FIRM|nr:GrdX family protein [Peptostreptococcus russellii]PSJ31313.1 glycine reductase [Peptostreptococcus russellii]
MLLITNNEKFLESEEFLTSNKIELKFLDNKDYIGVLEYSRNLIHEGYELLTHPLYGSVKPNETIYRTLILKAGKELDFNSLSLIEDAIETANKFKKNKITPLWTESVKDDFRVIDYDLMSKTIYRILN